MPIAPGMTKSGMHKLRVKQWYSADIADNTANDCMYRHAQAMGLCPNIRRSYGIIPEGSKGAV